MFKGLIVQIIIPDIQPRFLQSPGKALSFNANSLLRQAELHIDPMAFTPKCIGSFLIDHQIVQISESYLDYLESQRLEPLLGKSFGVRQNREKIPFMTLFRLISRIQQKRRHKIAAKALSSFEMLATLPSQR